MCALCTATTYSIWHWFTSITSSYLHIQVVDTPYIFGPSYSEEDQRRQVSEWKLMTSPGPSAILLALSGKDVFTSQHYDDYQKLKTLWGEDFCRRLIIVFTFTDEPHAPSLEEQLKVADPKLKCILQSTGDYYKVNNTVSEEENSVVVQQILNCVESKGKAVMYIPFVILISF